MDFESIKEQALKILLSGKELTNLDGYRLWSTLNLRNRISELGFEGYNIKRELVKNAVNGKMYCRYWMTPDEIARHIQKQEV